jgi:hypothetical protein
MGREIKNTNKKGKPFVVCAGVELTMLNNQKTTTVKAGRPSSHSSISFSFDADFLKNSDPLPVLLQSITELPGLETRHKQLYTILAELYSNSLEHGLLQLSSSMKNSPEGFSQYYKLREMRLAGLTEGSIKVDITHLPAQTGGGVLVRIEDSGPGFDYLGYNVSLDTNIGHCGRGVPLIKSLCQSVTYHGRGNIVEAIYKW